LVNITDRARELAEKARERYYKAFIADDISEQDIVEVTSDAATALQRVLDEATERGVRYVDALDIGMAVDLDQLRAAIQGSEPRAAPSEQEQIDAAEEWEREWCENCGGMALSPQVERPAPNAKESPKIDDLLLQEIFSLREKLKIAIEAIKSYDPDVDAQLFAHRLGSVDYEQLMEELAGTQDSPESMGGETKHE
jgi:hypothetical protein